MSHANIDASKARIAAKKVIDDILKKREEQKERFRKTWWGRLNYPKKGFKSLYEENMKIAKNLLSLADNSSDGLVVVDDEGIEVLKDFL